LVKRLPPSALLERRATQSKRKRRDAEQDPRHG
jgi:hypothetical protein